MHNANISNQEMNEKILVMNVILYALESLRFFFFFFQNYSYDHGLGLVMSSLTDVTQIMKNWKNIK